MPNETRSMALKRARRLNIPTSHVVKNPQGSGYFIAPRSVHKKVGRETYAALRGRGESKAKSARIAYWQEHRND